MVGWETTKRARLNQHLQLESSFHPEQSRIAFILKIATL